jgi:hypothetical protein
MTDRRRVALSGESCEEQNRLRATRVREGQVERGLPSLFLVADDHPMAAGRARVGMGVKKHGDPMKRSQVGPVSLSHFDAPIMKCGSAAGVFQRIWIFRTVAGHVEPTKHPGTREIQSAISGLAKVFKFPSCSRPEFGETFARSSRQGKARRSPDR